jgi:2-polyprenyl-3-methyl-5-hydroxy-6-metoxy-1,4-benzoquinol methylase
MIVECEIIATAEGIRRDALYLWAMQGISSTAHLALVVLLALAMAAQGGCASHDPPGSDAAAREAHHAATHTSGQASGHTSEHVSPHGHHRFTDAEQWARHFDDPARDEWQRPDAVIDRLELKDGMRVADIGSGTGYFAVRLARAIPDGRIWGIDIEPEMVSYLNERAEREGLANLESRPGLPHDPQLPDHVDLVLIVDTYHHLSDRTAYFRGLVDDLASGGRVAIVDFKLGDLPVGPPDSMKISADAIIEEMQAAGYRLVTDDRELLPYQVILVFTAPSL